MYRNCKVCKCCNNEEKEHIHENVCDNVISTMNFPCENECACGFEEEGAFPDNPMLGQSYVPRQKLNKTFTPEVGLKMGTIFPELVSPYMPCQSIDEIEYLKKTNKIKEGCNRV